jgi:glycosyltransferase involved in cell wall biosynthesis
VEGRRRALNRNVKVTTTDNKPVSLRVSVFTPTFNRAGKLHRVFDSLLAQTCPHSWFEWIVIDDGSIDDTGRVVDDFRARADFDLVYRYQPNRGKHIAHNRALELARGEFFLVCDSADAFDANAIEYFLTRWEGLDVALCNRLYGINVRSRDQTGRTRTPAMPRSPMISNNAEAVIVHGQTGDAWGIARTEVMREFPFPESHQGSHYPETIIWNKLGWKYEALYTNDVLHTTFYDTSDSITRSELAQDKTKLAHKILRESAANIEGDFRLFWRAPFFFVKKALLYNHFRKALRSASLAEDQKLNGWGRLWCFLFRPLNPFLDRFIERRVLSVDNN